MTTLQASYRNGSITPSVAKWPTIKTDGQLEWLSQKNPYHYMAKEVFLVLYMLSKVNAIEWLV